MDIAAMLIGYAAIFIAAAYGLLMALKRFSDFNPVSRWASTMPKRE